MNIIKSLIGIAITWVLVGLGMIFYFSLAGTDLAHRTFYDPNKWENKMMELASSTSPCWSNVETLSQLEVDCIDKDYVIISIPAPTVAYLYRWTDPYQNQFREVFFRHRTLDGLILIAIYGSTFDDAIRGLGYEYLEGSLISFGNDGVFIREPVEGEDSRLYLGCTIDRGLFSWGINRLVGCFNLGKEIYLEQTELRSIFF